MSYESLWSTCFPDEPMPKGELSMSLNQVIPFFRLHRLKLVAVDIFRRVVAFYDPKMDDKVMNRHVSPGILRVLVHQGHAYAINHDVKAFDIKIMEPAPPSLVPPSIHYYVRDSFQFADDKVIDDTDAIIKYVADFKGESKLVRIVCNLNIEQVMVEFRDKYGIVASTLSAKKDRVTGFCLEQGGVTFRICNMMAHDEVTDYNIENGERYIEFMKQYERVYHALLNKNNKSM
jgi:hypothetical protein